MCVCPGTARGFIRFFRQNERYGKEDIVVMESWLTQQVMAAKGAGALLSKTGGLTSHASIIARELQIPAIVSVDIQSLEKSQEVIVEAEEEQITIL